MSEDHLSNEVSVEAKIEGKSVVAKIKSRFLSATDRLLGGAADIPAAYFENISKKMRTKGDVEVKMIEAEGKAAIEKLADDPDFGIVIAGEYTKSEIRKIENKKKIVEASIGYINDGNDDNSSEETAENLDEDWLNYFEGYAEKASSERMQGLWARVLAGEVRKPTTFSLTTLRFISELDQEIAEKFQKNTRLAFREGMIVTSDGLSGSKLEDYSFLQEAGLFKYVDGRIQHVDKPDDDGKTIMANGSYALVMEVTKDLAVTIVSLTRTGMEILSILPPNDEKECLKSYYHACNEGDIKSASLYSLIRNAEGKHAKLKLLEKWK